MAIEKLFSIVRKMAQQEKSGEAAYKLMKTIMSGSGKETLILEGKALHQLPEQLSIFTQGLKKPKVMLGLKSSKKGSGVCGISIVDGDKSVAKFAVGMDETRGLPILQIRGRNYANGEKIEGLSSFFNPNVKVNPKNYAHINKGTNITSELYAPNGEVAGAVHCNGSGGMLSELANDAKLKPTEFKTTVKSFADFWARKGKTTLPVTSCEKELLSIVKSEGQPTIEAVTRAKDLLVKRMGYNPKNIPIESCSEMGGAAAAFDPELGKLLINSEVLSKCTNAEVAFLLSHELQHMDDFIKISKSIGIKGLQKLQGSTINKKFYEEMSKCTGEIDHNVKQIVDDIKAHYSPLKYKGYYAEVLRDDAYALSILEDRARGAERKVLDLFRKKGIDIQTKAYPIELYARESSSSLRPVLKRLEPKLPKEGRDTFFNRRYAAAFKKVEPELYALSKKSRLTQEEAARYKELAEKYLSEEEFQRIILLQMEKMFK